MTILNSTFSENIGAGILNTGTVSLANSTVSGGGAGLFPYTIGIDNSGTMNFSNTILANSYSADCYNQDSGIIGTNVNNLIGSNAAAPNDCGTPALTADPMLAPLGNNGGLTQTMALLPGSPAIDAGENTICPATDQREIIRPQGSQCDIGAYELRGGGAFPATPSFADVPVTHPFWEDIEILYANGLTGGCSTSPLKFCPDQIMNRGQAAVFILRANFGSKLCTARCRRTSSRMTGARAPGRKAGRRECAMKGLSAGCLTNPLKYCPWDQIPREQAVIFALRMKYGTLYTPPAATGTVFADMTNPSYYATSWAEQAYKEGIIPYCGMSAGKPKICPKDLVSRGLGAYMIVRAKNLMMP